VRAIDLSGKNALVLGVANQRSLAWAIAEALAQAGCRLAFTYQGERLEQKVRDLAAELPNALVVPCDVTNDEQLDALFALLAREFGRLDILIHSIAFARREELEGEFRKTTREGWRLALEISAYSLVDLANRATPLMDEHGGSIVCLTYIAAQRVVPNYNVMGSAKAALDHCTRQLAFELGPKKIRVNAISAGPVRTLAARSIAGFTTMEEMFEQRAPLHRAIDAADCGAAAAYLLSDDARNVTGTTLYVDAGYHAMGM
jgi:enoyl-[acyl-carrier protein] reductase I